jgi:hypothetical protein
VAFRRRPPELLDAHRAVVRGIRKTHYGVNEHTHLATNVQGAGCSGVWKTPGRYTLSPPLYEKVAVVPEQADPRRAQAGRQGQRPSREARKRAAVGPPAHRAGAIDVHLKDPTEWMDDLTVFIGDETLGGLLSVAALRQETLASGGDDARKASRVAQKLLKIQSHFAGGAGRSLL